jgi:hypothetical protein
VAIRAVLRTPTAAWAGGRVTLLSDYDNVNYTRGQHAFKFGFNFLHNYSNYTTKDPRARSLSTALTSDERSESGRIGRADRSLVGPPQAVG